MKKYSGLILCFLALNCFAQKNKDLKFKVSGTKFQVRIYPEDNYLFVGGKNRIKITVKGKGKIAEVILKGGNIKGKDSLYRADVTSGQKAMLSVYVEGPRGKKILAANKEYIIVPYPEVNYNGVALDSAIDNLSLMGGRLFANYKLINAGAKVLSFKVPILEKGKFKQDSVTGNRMDQKMRDYVNTLKNGDIIYFEDIKVLTPDNRIQNVPALRLFVIEAERPLQWGF